MQTNPDEEVFSNEFRRAVAANYVTFHVLYVAFCLHTTVYSMLAHAYTKPELFLICLYSCSMTVTYN